MSLKKPLISALCVACAISLLIPTAFAHGCHGGRRARRTVQPCTVEGCTITGYHYHDSTIYCGHTHGNDVCDGTCALLCPVEGCELTGRHYHDGVVYCGANHADGYCDGNCPYTLAQDSSWSGGHHAGRHCGW